MSGLSPNPRESGKVHGATVVSLIYVGRGV